MAIRNKRVRSVRNKECPMHRYPSTLSISCSNLSQTFVDFSKKLVPSLIWLNLMISQLTGRKRN